MLVDYYYKREMNNLVSLQVEQTKIKGFSVVGEYLQGVHSR